MKPLGLGKKDKLCSARAIEVLFGPGGADFTRLSYPLRAVARSNNEIDGPVSMRFLISVPKKRLRHAVDRVKMRRRIREAYRLNRGKFSLADDARFDIAFVYVANGLTDYAAVEKAMCRILEHLAAKSSANNETHS